MEDEIKIQQVVHRFSNAFDLKDWPALESCFAPKIRTDYSDLRGAPPETIEAKQYVASRQESLKNLKTHHLCGNHEIEINGNGAVCKTSMIIYRLDEAKQESFTTHAYYIFAFEKINAVWRISGITQKIFWNEGNPSIHKGVK
jgi:hypothetical protein